MKNKIKVLEIAICIFSLMLPMFLMVGCSPNDKFDAEWIIGKTAEEIEERYGEFDKIKSNYGAYKTFHKSSDEDIFEKMYQFFVDCPGIEDLYYVIYFDSYGYAYSIKRDVYLGPKGG